MDRRRVVRVDEVDVEGRESMSNIIHTMLFTYLHSWIVEYAHAHDVSEERVRQAALIRQREIDRRWSKSNG